MIGSVIGGTCGRERDPSPEKTDETNPRLICFFDLSQTTWERLTATATAVLSCFYIYNFDHLRLV
jgi:hypothetical protein